MPTITKIADYTGRFQIAKDAYSKKTLQYYIDSLEYNLIYELLGAELGTLFIADLDVNGVPQTQRFIDIYNAFAIDNDCKLIASSGVKSFLIGQIYFDYCRNDNTYNSQIGNKGSVSENSNIAGNLWNDLSQRYNIAIENGKSIQWYVGSYKAEDYPEYKGIELQTTHWL